MYEKIGTIEKSTKDALLKLAKDAEWKITQDDDRDYRTSYITEQAQKIKELSKLWPTKPSGGKGWRSAVLILIPPGGKMHKHADNETHIKSFCICLRSNKDCLSFTGKSRDLELTSKRNRRSYRDVGEDVVETESFNLRAGNIYSADRTKIHWSENNGKSNRIHLLVEIYV